MRRLDIFDEANANPKYSPTKYRGAFLAARSARERGYVPWKSALSPMIYGRPSPHLIQHPTRRSPFSFMRHPPPRSRQRHVVARQPDGDVPNLVDPMEDVQQRLEQDVGAASEPPPDHGT